MSAGRSVHLAADDGLDPRRYGRLVEIYRTVHHAVVGDGDGIHTKRLGPFDQVLDPRRAVQQAVFGVYMQVGEAHL